MTSNAGRPKLSRAGPVRGWDVKGPNCSEAVSKEVNGWIQGASDGGTRRV